jgi:hypothetical protein
MAGVPGRAVKALPCLILCLVLVGITADASAQQVVGISVEYGLFPPRHLANPEAGTFEEDLKIGLTILDIRASFPLVFAGGRTLVLNSIEYGRLGVDFRNWDEEEAGDPDEQDEAHSVKFASFVMHELSPEWRLIAGLTPGLASDFQGEISGDDFTLEAVLGLIRQVRESLAFGFGVAYVRDFGEPLPLPFLALEWQIAPNLNARALLPQDFEVSYNWRPKVDLGLAVKVRGNRYHGDPGVWGADNPQMKHTVASVGPTARIHLSKWLHLGLEGGYVFVHNFEFLDGDKVESLLDMEHTGYLRAGLQLGM